MLRRILVVDDQPEIRALVSRGFRERGYEVVEAGDGMAALGVARSASQPFDLVVTNSRMPFMDGPQLVEHLRQLDPDLPIMHLSGSHGLGTMKDLPADVPTIFKPFSIWGLLDEAEQLMDQHDSGTAQAG
jgi:two-component system, cell cycle sensor histidine kinase and response regulator CckA